MNESAIEAIKINLKNASDSDLTSLRNFLNLTKNEENALLNLDNELAFVFMRGLMMAKIDSYIGTIIRIRENGYVDEALSMITNVKKIIFTLNCFIEIDNIISSFEDMYVYTIFMYKQGCNKQKPQIKEIDYNIEISNRMGKDIMKEYEFLHRELKASEMDNDRIDILAKHIITGRIAIIELKLGSKSGHKQLRSYAVGFDNPILINISEDDVKLKRDDIKYMTFSDIGLTREYMIKKITTPAHSEGVI